MPSEIALEYTAISLPRRSSGKESAIIDMARGLSVASPTSTDMRAMNSWTKLRAKPDRAVATDRTAISVATIQVRRPRSAS